MLEWNDLRIKTGQNHKWGGEHMKIMTINVPVVYVPIMDKFVPKNYPSRSELVRVALEEFFERKTRLNGELEKLRKATDYDEYRREEEAREFTVDESKVRVLTNPNGHLARCDK